MLSKKKIGDSSGPRLELNELRPQLGIHGLEFQRELIVHQTMCVIFLDVCSFVCQYHNVPSCGPSATSPAISARIMTKHINNMDIYGKQKTKQYFCFGITTYEGIEMNSWWGVGFGDRLRLWQGVHDLEQDDLIIKSFLEENYSAHNLSINWFPFALLFSCHNVHQESTTCLEHMKDYVNIILCSYRTRQ